MSLQSDMQSTSKYTIGVRYGLVAGLVYFILLYLRYKFFAASPMSFGMFTLVSYLIILVIYFMAGLARRKQLGGFGTVKELFQSVFIVILIAEIAYVVFNFIYLKFIDPQFWVNFRDVTYNFFKSQNLPADQIDSQMKSFKDIDQATNPLGLIKGLGFGIIIDSIFGFVFAAILQKKRTTVNTI